MLKFYNTKSHSVEEFKTIDGSNTVRMYGCGPTVYNYAHIGNLRAFVFYDLLRRYLKFKGYDVNFVMNITDVDDKTIRSSREKGQSLRDYTTFYMNEFFKDLETINVGKPTRIVRATDEIDAMVDTIELLIQKGYAYKTASGDIFFKISAFPEYGKMANINPRALLSNAGGRLSDEYEKEDAQDFALWKAWTEADGDVFWETRIGKGRPGWHIECSTIAHKYLGQPFDIHTGGIDLIFPHHTNEIAQSESAYGTMFCNFFMHNDYLKVNGEKMSKSKHNFYTLHDLLEKGYDKRAIRYEFLKSSYRQTLDFLEANMVSNKSVIDRFDNFMDRLDAANGAGWDKLDEVLSKAVADFTAGMDNDLNTPAGLAVIFDLMSEVNKNFDKLSKQDGAKVATQMSAFDMVFGILKEKSDRQLTAEEQSIIDRRQAARVAKDWATADALKAELIARGIEVKDTPQGPQIRFV